MKLSLQRIALIVFGLGIIGLIAYGFRPQPLPVDMTEVTQGELTVTVDEDGRTRVINRYTVSSPLGGQLQRIDLRSGDRVINGSSPTIIASIVPQPSPLLDPSAEAGALAAVDKADAAIKQANALVERANQNYQDSRNNLQRVERLRSSPAFQQEEWERAQYRERMAAADLRAAEFSVQVAKFEKTQAEAVLQRNRSDSVGSLPQMDIASPITGRVFRILEESEKIVAPGQGLVEVGDPTDIEILIDVLSADAVKIREGNDVILEHWGGDDPLHAKVTVVEPSGYLKISALGVEEQRVNIIARLIDKPEKRPNLGDGYRVEAKIVVWHEKAIVKVKEGALFRKGKDWAVFVVDNGVARLRKVEVGRSNGIERQILSGLSPKDTVILHPSDKVKDGLSVVARKTED